MTTTSLRTRIIKALSQRLEIAEISKPSSPRKTKTGCLSTANWARLPLRTSAISPTLKLSGLPKPSTSYGSTNEICQTRFLKSSTAQTSKIQSTNFMNCRISVQNSGLQESKNDADNLKMSSAHQFIVPSKNWCASLITKTLSNSMKKR